MTSEQSKTLAFLARRVGALEKKVEILESTQAQLVTILSAVINNQDEFRPMVMKMFDLVDRVDSHIKKTEAAWAQVIT